MSAEYERGYADGRASRDADFDGLQRQADYWYFRAMNPGVPTADEKMIDSIISGREENERRAAQWAALDAVEAELFDEARELIATTDDDDIAIAKKVGLLVTVVANIRGGLL